MDGLPIELLNPERDVASGMHEPEGEMLWSVPNNASEADDKLSGGLADNKSPSDFNASSLQKGVKVELEHTSDKGLAKEIAMDHLTEDPKYYDKLELIEANLISAFRKESMGLLDIPTSIGGGDEPDEQGEVLTFKGTPQNPGLSREMGDDEETDFFGASEEGVDISPKNTKYKSKIHSDGEVMINELDKLEKHLRLAGKLKEADAITGMKKKAGPEGAAAGAAAGLAAGLLPGLGLIPAPIRVLLGGTAGHKIQQYFASSPEAKSALEQQKDIVAGLQTELRSHGVDNAQLGQLESRTLTPGDLAGKDEQSSGDPDLLALAEKYILAVDKLTQIFEGADDVTGQPVGDTSQRLPAASPARGSITREGDPYTYDKNPNGEGYVVVSGPTDPNTGKMKGVGNVLLPGTDAHDLVQAADTLGESEPEAAPEDPNKAQARDAYSKALAAAGRGEFDQAAGLFQQSFDLIPHPDTLFNLGKALYDGGDTAAALEAFTRLRDEYPDAFSEHVEGGSKEPIPEDMLSQLSQDTGGSEELQPGPGEVRVRQLDPEKKARVMRALKLDELPDPEDAYSRWLAQPFKLHRGPIESRSGRQIAIVDYGFNLKDWPDVRYDGISTEDGTSWSSTDLSRKERRDLELRGKDNKSVRQEMRRERRPSNLRSNPRADKREEKQRERLRRRERARKESRLIQIKELNKVAESTK